MDNNVKTFSAMQEGSPFKSYIKTILGKVFVTVWDNFAEAPTSLLLTGDPKNQDEDSILDVWSAKEDLFLRNMNRVHFKNGTLIEYVRPAKVRERTIEEWSDEELVELLSSPFLKIQNKLNSIETVPVVFRILGLARDHNKSEKIIKAIELRLSELQGIE